jgi:hypothetical protein
MESSNGSKPTLQDYQKQLEGKDCRWCRDEDEETKTMVFLNDEPLEHYEHDGGYWVDGYPTKRWIYVVCPKCKYQWSLRKLGITRQ